MVTIDIRHKVEDFATWKAVFDAARDVRREAGELACRIYTVHGSETDVMVSVDSGAAHITSSKGTSRR